MSELSIQAVCQIAGVSSRTLRHYDAIGLLKPSSTNASGNRKYDQACLLRLQQIILLRQVGVSLFDISQIVDGQRDQLLVLRDHVTQLEQQMTQLNTQIHSIRKTIAAFEKGEELMPKEMFEGFDHTEYREEVEQRWGKKALRDSESWWKASSRLEQDAFKAEHMSLQDGYDAAIVDGQEPADDFSQRLAKRHFEWVQAAWGNRPVTRLALEGMANMYVEDPRFAANYTRVSDRGAEFVRDALLFFAKTLE